MMHIRRKIHLRNKFHFSEVHGNMNSTDHVQSKWCPKGVTLTLHRTGCVYLRKIRSFVYLRKILVFTPFMTIILWNFDLSLENNRRRKVIIWRAWLLRSTAVTILRRQSKVTSANQQLHLSMTSFTHKVTWTSVVHRCMNLVGPK